MAIGAISRRIFVLGPAAAAFGSMLGGRALAADTVRYGIQIGALGALRTTLPDAAKKYDITYDMKDFVTALRCCLPWSRANWTSATQPFNI